MRLRNLTDHSKSIVPKLAGREDASIQGLLVFIKKPSSYAKNRLYLTFEHLGDRIFNNHEAQSTQ
jgi:hypothetical protein